MQSGMKGQGGMIGAVIGIFVLMVIAFAVVVPVIGEVINASDLQIVSEVTANTAGVLTALTYTPVDSANSVYTETLSFQYNDTNITDAAVGNYTTVVLTHTPTTTMNANITIKSERNSTNLVTVAINGHSLGNIGALGTDTWTGHEAYINSGNNVVSILASNATGSNITNATITYYYLVAYPSTSYNISSTGITTAATGSYLVNYNYHNDSGTTTDLLGNLVPLFVLLGLVIIAAAWVWTKVEG